MLKKRIITGAIVTLLLIIIIVTINYFYPRTVHFTASGIQYQLGSEHHEHTKTVTVMVDGKVKKKLNGERNFVGRIDIPELELPIPEHAELVEMPLDENNAAVMTYTFVESGMPYLYSVGRIFFNDAFNELTILLTTYEAEGKGSWSSEDGMMLSAPANSRAQALGISSKLMKIEEHDLHPLQ